MAPCINAIDTTTATPTRPNNTKSGSSARRAPDAARPITPSTHAVAQRPLTTHSALGGAVRLVASPRAWAAFIPS